MDFLSYLTYQNIHELQSSAVVLNSVSNYEKVQELLQKHQFSKVYFFLDNDEAGRETLKKLTSIDDKPVSFAWKDMSVKYARCKDFNAFLLKR